ncbi:unnamed protein product [Chrysoparadoxa australica]
MAAVGPRRILYVGGLEEKVTEEVVHAAFIPFGDIVEVQIPRDWKEGTNRGFAFVEFELEGDAQAAKENMDGAELYGRVLRVNLARPMKHKLGNVKAIWNADDWFQNQQVSSWNLFFVSPYLTHALLILLMQCYLAIRHNHICTPPQQCQEIMK